VPDIYLDRDVLNAVEKTHGVTITTVVTKPKSRGYVKLRSADPADMPIVSPHLLQHPDDMKTMIAGQRFFLRAFHEGPLGARIARIVKPDPADLSDEALTTHCKRLVKTNYHPAGTCRMGADGDRLAVLDAQLRVRGIDNLRVADMSVCPNINAGNTAAPAMMIGDRCASFILDPALASAGAAEARHVA
jgi:choline dehydrogenase